MAGIVLLVVLVKLTASPKQRGLVGAPLGLGGFWAG